MSSVSPEIIKTDTEIVIKYPKHSDLDIKFYNPEIIQSLGFKGATVNLDTLGPNTMFGGGLFDYEPVPDQPIEKLTYPYRYFAYMFKSFNPNSPTDNTPDIKTDGLIGAIMDTVKDSDGLASVPEPQPTKKPGFFSMFLKRTNDTSEQKPEEQEQSTGGLLDSILPAASEQKPEEHEQSTGGLLDSILPAASEQKPEEQEQSTGGLLDSILPAASEQPPEEQQTSGGLLDSILPAASEQKPEEQQQSTGGLLDSILPAASEQKPEEQQQSTGGLLDSILPAASEQKPEEQQPAPSGLLDSILSSSKTEEQTSSPSALTVVSPAVETDPPQPIPFAPITTPFSAKWEIHIPIISNQVLVPDGIAEKQNEEFEDVLAFSEMEARNGIYVRGEFVNILGRNVKIGSVEQLNSGEKMRTVKEYLSGRVLLDGTKQQKYSALMV